ncbi:MAG: C25 family cysteine peptidase [Desulfobacteraceae bacterium]|nr:C25 family cysteine peptidase [Desulfobacteraceae bacterium]
MVFCFFSSMVPAQANDTSPNWLTIESEQETELVLNFQVPSYEIIDWPGPDGRRYQQIKGNGWPQINTAGAPELPVFGTLIQVPADCKILVTILSSRMKDVGNYEFLPVPEYVTDSDNRREAHYDKDPAIYQADRFFPEQMATTDSVQIMRREPVSRLKIFPFQWHPATGVLRCYEDIQLKIEFIPNVQQTGVKSANSSLDLTMQSIDTGLSTIEESSVFRQIKSTAIFNYQPARKSDNLEIKAPLVKAVASFEGTTAIQMEIGVSGIYRLPYSALANQGLDVNAIDSSCFKLFCNGAEVGIRVNEMDGFIEFYGTAIDNQYTGTNVYQLYWDAGEGQRMATINAACTSGLTPVESFRDTVHVENNTDFWAKMPGAPHLDYWFWSKLTAPVNQTYSITLSELTPDAEDAEITLCFQGRTISSIYPDHHTRIYLNNEKISDETWEWNNAYVQQSTVPQSLLKEGDNSLRISCPGDTGASADIVYFNWVEIGCRRNLTAINDSLLFFLSGDGSAQSAKVSGFTSDAIRIYDITDPAAPKRLIDFDILEQDGKFSAVFESQIDGNRTFQAIAENGIQTPENITGQTSSWLLQEANGADYIIITDPLLASAVTSLADYHESLGRRVMTVSTDDIYDAFSNGIFDPEAIRDFLRYAYDNYSPPAPVYVMLVGDANIDYRDYYGTGKKNLAPVHLSVTAELGLTPDDNWYVCLDDGDDVLPDMLIGRIPGNTGQIVFNIIEKIINYDSDVVFTPQSVLFTADDELQFEGISDTLADALPDDLNARKVYLRTYGSNTSGATSAIISAINQGQLATVYTGHGSLTNWAGEFMFDTADINQLNNNGKLCFVMALDCINGYFSQPMQYGLGQEFIRAENKGAVACFAPSGLGNPWEHQVLGQNVFDLLFNQCNIIGAVAVNAKINAYAQGVSADMICMFNLFGDPATRLKYDSGPCFVRGDINGDNSVDLADAICALKVLAGLSPDGLSNANAVGGDSRIGIEDAIYALMVVSGMRDAE